MSRVSKIPAHHQTRCDGLLVASTFALPRNPKSQTTPEQAASHQALYRSKCAFRRNGSRIETLDENGQWTLHESFKFIASAKAATSNRRYAVPR